MRIAIELLINCPLTWFCFSTIVREFLKGFIHKNEVHFQKRRSPFQFLSQIQKKSLSPWLDSSKNFTDLIRSDIWLPSWENSLLTIRNDLKWKVVMLLNILLPKFFENFKFLNALVQKRWNVSIWHLMIWNRTTFQCHLSWLPYLNLCGVWCLVPVDFSHSFSDSFLSQLLQAPYWSCSPSLTLLCEMSVLGGHRFPWHVVLLWQTQVTDIYRSLYIKIHASACKYSPRRKIKYKLLNAFSEVQLWFKLWFSIARTQAETV